MTGCGRWKLCADSQPAKDVETVRQGFRVGLAGFSVQNHAQQAQYNALRAAAEAFDRLYPFAPVPAPEIDASHVEVAHGGHGA